MKNTDKTMEVERKEFVEPDSTTFENEKLSVSDDRLFPFTVSSLNRKFYKDHIYDKITPNGEKVSEWLQQFGLIPKQKVCVVCQPHQMTFRRARVVDRWQWQCDMCGLRKGIRDDSIFSNIQCSLVQGLILILAWCEDADCDLISSQLGLKPRVVSMMYDRLDDLAVELQNTLKLGGENGLIIAEMYPDCLNRLSPDTTDEPHKHRILMLADTNNIPTNYWLHVMTSNSKSTDRKEMAAEVNSVLPAVSVVGAALVAGDCVPLAETRSHSLNHLAAQCDNDMRHFLCERVWRQAITVCSASRDICSGAGAAGPAAECARLVQRYLHTALHRLRHPDGFYEITLRAVARKYAN